MSVPRWPTMQGRATTAPDGHLLRSWRADPDPFWAVVLLIRDTAVEERRRAVAASLHPWCRATTPGQAHITLAACGPRPADGLPWGQLVEAGVCGADSFDSAAFLRAGAPDLARLRMAVLAACGCEADLGPQWVPHVTVGTYRWSASRAAVASRLAAHRHRSEIRTMARLTLVVVDRSTGNLRQMA